MERVTEIFAAPDLQTGIAFKPSEIELNSFLVETPKETQEPGEVVVTEESSPDFQSFSREDGSKTNVVATDSTSFILGYIPDGVVGVVRVSVVTNHDHSNNRSLQLYGPYLIAVNTVNNDIMHKKLNKTIFAKEEEVKAPAPIRMIERVRGFLENYVQMQLACNLANSVLLFDGSLIGGTVDTPIDFRRRLIASAKGRMNSIMAISKHTNLTLSKSRRNILSLLEGVDGPVFVGGIKDKISQDRANYLGDIYISRFSPNGEAFRVDIPPESHIAHEKLFSIVSSMCGEYGYPEELKLAHMCCVHSSLELLELQAAAIGIHGMTIKEDLRKKIFPL